MQPGEIEYHNPEQARNKARDKWIAARTRQEQKLEAWRVSLTKCKDTLTSKIPFDWRNMTLQSEVPEWYAESPNEEIANQQVDALNQKLAEVRGLVEEYNKEGLALLEKYNSL